jgi:hypothetical protein
MTRFNVICTGSGIHKWGKSWIEHMLSHLNCKFHYLTPSDDIPLLEKCIVVTNTTESYFYIRRLQQAHLKYGVILLSDECLDSSLAFLNNPDCMFLAETMYIRVVTATSRSFTLVWGTKTSSRSTRTHAELHRTANSCGVSPAH